MAPNSDVVEEPVPLKLFAKPGYKIQILWMNVMVYMFLHGSFLYAVFLGLTVATWKTVLFAYIYGRLGAFGITAGLHRLWSHRSYKAKWPLRVLLCCLASIAAQSNIFRWCRTHRVHHKFTDTNADPHNIKRGFFFAHIGWLMCKMHPDVLEKEKTVFMDDLWADPIVRFHNRFYIPMNTFFCFVLPTVIPAFWWGETIWNSFFFAGLASHCLSLNFTFLVNSAAHTYGNQPYNKYIEARENAFIAIFTLGEGWHNYHHVFPWDYSTSELGYTLNLTKLFIDFMALSGQAYDLKSAHPEMVKEKKLKMGDATRLKQMDEQEKNFLCPQS